MKKIIKIIKDLFTTDEEYHEYYEEWEWESEAEREAFLKYFKFAN